MTTPIEWAAKKGEALMNIENYVAWCDSNGVDPSEANWLAFFGIQDHGDVEEERVRLLETKNRLLTQRAVYSESRLSQLRNLIADIVAKDRFTFAAPETRELARQIRAALVTARKNDG